MNTAKSACRKGMMLKGNLLTYWQTSFTFIGWICYLGVVDGNVKHSAHTQPDVIGESVKYYALNQTYTPYPIYTTIGKGDDTFLEPTYSCPNAYNLSREDFQKSK